jgi:hypothetical protein
MRGSGWRREAVPATTTTGGEVPSRRGWGGDLGARTLGKTTMRHGVGEHTPAPVLTRSSRRRSPVPTMMRGGDGPTAEEERCVWARTLAKWAQLRTEANWRALLAFRGRAASNPSASRRSRARIYPFGSSFCFWRPEAAQKLNQTGAWSLGKWVTRLVGKDVQPL